MPPLTPTQLIAALLMMILMASVVAVWAIVFVRILLEQPVLPDSTPRVVPWGAGSVLGSILAWFGLQNVTALLYLIATRPPGGNVPKTSGSPFSPAEQMGLSAAANVAAVILIPLLLRASSGARLRDFGIEARGLARRILEGVLAYPLLAPCVFGLMLVCVAIWGKSDHPLQQAMMDDRSAGTVALLFFAGSIMAPIAEELLFRGVLLGWLTRLAMRPEKRDEPDAASDWTGGLDSDPGPAQGSFLTPISIEAEDAEGEPFNPYQPPAAPVTADPAPKVAIPSRLILANMAVSAVFALLHGPQWPAPVPLFVLSMGLGFLYQRTGSLVGPIALHMTFNGISTLMLFLAGPMTPAAPKAPAPIPGPAFHSIETTPSQIGAVAR
ncbi:CPBP family intramembrane glutamic endopeptidase [Tundrisphaera sp. TA3]|uniref:CPBP family intramembrane glutamic endopeptidase n=1 Tax=Tundrisphaera sp. TA3 TaxID=3435775 RepID=UPI003EBC86DA